MGVGDLVAVVTAAHVGTAGLALGSAFHVLTAQDACVRGDSHDDVPMEQTMYGPLASAMITTMSRRPSAPSGDGDENEHMWLLELALAWARLDAATCGSHALAASEPLITTALAIVPPKRPTMARAGC
jgi:hypothetical protein